MECCLREVQTISSQRKKLENQTNILKEHTFGKLIDKLISERVLSDELATLYREEYMFKYCDIYYFTFECLRYLRV